MTVRIVKTEDGSLTFFSEKFKEPYHSVTAGAFREAVEKFCVPAKVSEKVKDRGRFNLFDFCFGLSYNTVAFLDTVFRENPEARVRIVGVERDIRVIENSLKIPWHRFEKWKWVLREILKNRKVEGGFLTLNCFIPQVSVKVFVGEARDFLKRFAQRYIEFADAIFHDPFSPKVNPELWTYEVFLLERKICKEDGILVTYSTSSAVRRALMMAGFGVRNGVVLGRKTPSTVASPLFETEEKIKRKKAVPYRDPDLRDSPDLIKNRKKGCEYLIGKQAVFECLF
ncbi:tRNA U34 5-methylaminomethyl-2-thiouridine-forming methyltransferase MnmC [Desulfurobacterium pacificum]|uniref:tRNA U34 5-methylaminomethyl-2-thiouridine-forming methyltransferase MnmC n=1 Tax=Desulfurobacterium pacificum TaxID=240166 RepID=A0ABY1NQR2_9BACT|nr:MnmC family methyltransferase [Desulfurobacterium pacificum]SMP15806.1 tRNA U34 5-methylaminomethyl-2-thiouridine-forming methyltransferase MnmC [Desulfurobacterium pacificum]